MRDDLLSGLSGPEGPVNNTVERLFFCLMLPASAADAASEVLARSRAGHGLEGKPIRKDRLHVTLVHIGDYPNEAPPTVVEAMRQAGGSLAAPAFEVLFDRVSSFAGAPGKYPHVLVGEQGVEALKSFRNDLLKAVIRHGVKPLSRQQFTPHVTLSYADRRLPERPIRPVAWRPEEFVLIHSEVGRSTYHTLGCWPFR